MLPAPPSLLAVLPDHPGTTELIQYQLTGLIVVFTALCSIWVLLEIMGAFFRRQPAPAAHPAASLAPAPAEPAADAGMAPDTVAAIAAAVHVALRGRPHRIADIKPTPAGAAWASEGRREIFSSHRLR